MLGRLADLIERDLEELAELELIDNGKPYAVARVADLPLAVDMFRYMAGWAMKITGSTLSLSLPGEYLSYTMREPVGGVAQIIPWNFPLLMAGWKIGPALAAGCTIVLKAGRTDADDSAAFGGAIGSRIPRGVVNVVTGFGPTAGAALASHPDVDKVAFTGSTEVGKRSCRRPPEISSASPLSWAGRHPTSSLPMRTLMPPSSGQPPRNLL